MKTALQNCTLIIESNIFHLPGEGYPEFTIERMKEFIDLHSGNIEISCTTNYWQGDPKPVITLKINEKAGK